MPSKPLTSVPCWHDSVDAFWQLTILKTHTWLCVCVLVTHSNRRLRCIIRPNYNRGHFVSPRTFYRSSDSLTVDIQQCWRVDWRAVNTGWSSVCVCSRSRLHWSTVTNQNLGQLLSVLSLQHTHTVVTVALPHTHTHAPLVSTALHCPTDINSPHLLWQPTTVQAVRQWDRKCNIPVLSV